MADEGVAKGDRRYRGLSSRAVEQCQVGGCPRFPRFPPRDSTSRWVSAIAAPRVGGCPRLPAIAAIPAVGGCPRFRAPARWVSAIPRGEIGPVVRCRCLSATRVDACPRLVLSMPVRDSVVSMPVRDSSQCPRQPTAGWDQESGGRPFWAENRPLSEIRGEP